MLLSLPTRMVYATYVVGSLARNAWQLTMTTRPAKFVDFYVSAAIECWDTIETMPNLSLGRQLIYAAHQAEDYWENEIGLPTSRRNTDEPLDTVCDSRHHTDDMDVCCR